MLSLTLWCTTRGWNNSILPTGTSSASCRPATSAPMWMKEAGYRLDYETPLFGPPWSIPMEFPVYQWVVATASRRVLGTPLEQTARGVGVFFLLATLPAVYGLAGFFGLTPSRRLLVASAVLASPTYLFYSRTFMIETTAVCFSAWFLYALGRAVRDDCLRCAVRPRRSLPCSPHWPRPQPSSSSSGRGRFSFSGSGCPTGTAGRSRRQGLAARRAGGLPRCC